ncbi:cobaltochelatase CobT-related protein [Sedimenticola sp.]|uniref:cobaltochelatase CobT-related protein n=1 Tax=Sedimenticola sp. TaxID=1940285 RepID=UPI003D0E9224
MPETAADLFQRVTGATLRALAAAPDTPVRFAPSATSTDEDSVQLIVHGEGALSADDRQRLRGQADAAALRLRFHDARLHRLQLPGDGEARQLFELLEQARVEVLGTARLPGVAQNLAALLERRGRALGWARAQRRADVPLAEGVALLVRERLSGGGLPVAAHRAADFWRPWVTDQGVMLQLDALRLVIGDQAEYGRQVCDLLTDLGLDMRPREASASVAPSWPDESGNEGDATDAEGGAESADPGGGEAAEDAGQVWPAKSDSEGGGLSEAAADGGVAEQPVRVNWLDPQQAICSDYRAYSCEFDQAVEADELADSDELAALRRQLDSQLSPLQGLVARIANRLQRRLLVQQQRAWEFDQEEGLLDGARIARVVANPTHALSYKREKPAAFRDTVVTLLIDNSGSMRGRPITVAALSADILARTLERCGVKVEVLGFTTQAWKGGRVWETWQQAGEPTNPGRLNELRHIIYKPADQPWRRAKNRIGLMLKPGLLKENIDGEALIWAYRRLIRRPEARKILLVISDGAPVDDATLTANPPHYLDAHLRQVIQWLERRTPVQLMAIGIGHDVTRYYRQALMLREPEELGGAMLKQLAQLLDTRLAPG